MRRLRLLLANVGIRPRSQPEFSHITKPSLVIEVQLDEFPADPVLMAEIPLFDKTAAPEGFVGCLGGMKTNDPLCLVVVLNGTRETLGTIKSGSRAAKPD